MTETVRTDERPDREPMVTALFADISGFTTLADRLDADSLHEIIGPVIGRLAGIAERRGGFIAKYAGDALLVFFGFPEPSEGDATRALSTALEMHDELRAIVDDLPADAAGLELHIGVERGSVMASSREELQSGSILGDAVTLAQSLESVTPAGETYVGSRTRERAGETFSFEPLGELDARGRRLAAWRLVSDDRGDDGRLGPGDDVTDEALRALAEATAQTGSDAEERRLVTALFANFVGLHALTDEIGSDRVHEIVAPVVARLAAVAQRYEAFVARYAADALLAFFGAPVAHEDDPARALLVAQEMHRELERMLPDLPRAAKGLRLQIGINSGHVISGRFGGEVHADYSILGDAVNTAQRLQSVAPEGGTYVGELTYRLTNDRFVLEHVGDLTLKGKVKPVPAWRATRERDESEHATFRVGRPHPPLFGRDAELAAVTGVLERLDQGIGGLVAVSGEPGVGKSRLTQAVRDDAERRAVRWLDARCISYGAGLPYWPYADLVRRAFEIRIDDRPVDAGRRLESALRAAGLQEQAGFFGQLIGASVAGAGDMARLEPEVFRRELHAAFAAWVAAMARRGPVVISIEDVHWADASSGELTKQLLRLSGHVPVALYLTARPEAEAELEDIADVVDPGRVASVALHPLGRDAIKALVEWVLGSEPPAELVDAVVERTGGNPFFAEELVRSVVDAGLLFERDGRWYINPGWRAEAVPTSVEGVLSARIDMLPREVAGVLQTASVLGRRVRLPLLHAVTGDGAGLEGALERLVDSGFLDPLGESGEGDLYFHHALVQEVGYSRLVRRRREQLHLRVAEAGQALYGSGDDVVDLLARHYYLGRAGPKAFEYLVRAGDRAKRLFANDEALVHFGRAAEVSREEPSCADRLPRILLDLADLHDTVGRYDEAFEHYEELRGMTNDPLAWRGVAAILRKRGEYDEALRVVEDAFESCAVVGADQAPLWLERGSTLGLSGRYREGIEAMKAGLEAIGDADDPRAAQLLLQLSRQEIVESRLTDALEHAQQARGLFERLDDLRGLATALRIEGDVFTNLGRLDEAAGTLRRGLELAERVGTVEEIAANLVNLGLVEQDRGALDEAIAVTRRAAEEAERIGHEFGRSTAYGNLADMLVERGDLDGALEYTRKALDVAESIGYTMTVADAKQTLALIRLRQGAFGEAVERAKEAAALFEEMGAPAFASEALELGAQAEEGAGNTERAADLRRRARSLDRSSA